MKNINNTQDSHYPFKIILITRIQLFFQTFPLLSIFIKNLHMPFSEKRNLTRWIIIMTSFVIVALILLNTYNFFQIFKNEERVKMELWAQSLKTLLNADPETGDVELPRQIISNNKTIPTILVENNQI